MHSEMLVLSREYSDSNFLSRSHRSETFRNVPGGCKESFPIERDIEPCFASKVVSKESN